jgi:Zn ribbon nucleic-acid-binding protein
MEKIMEDNSKKKRKRLYSFPTVAACPRCRGTDTIVTSTQKNVQYRKCRSAICLQRFTVVGKKVKTNGIESLESPK